MLPCCLLLRFPKRFLAKILNDFTATTEYQLQTVQLQTSVLQVVQLHTSLLQVVQLHTSLLQVVQLHTSLLQVVQLQTVTLELEPCLYL